MSSILPSLQIHSLALLESLLYILCWAVSSGEPAQSWGPFATPCASKLHHQYLLTHCLSIREGPAPLSPPTQPLLYSV